MVCLNVGSANMQSIWLPSISLYLHQLKCPPSSVFLMSNSTAASIALNHNNWHEWITYWFGNWLGLSNCIYSFLRYSSLNPSNYHSPLVWAQCFWFSSYFSFLNYSSADHFRSGPLAYRLLGTNRTGLVMSFDSTKEGILGWEVYMSLMVLLMDST